VDSIAICTLTRTKYHHAQNIILTDVWACAMKRLYSDNTVHHTGNYGNCKARLLHTAE